MIVRTELIHISIQNMLTDLLHFTLSMELISLFACYHSPLFCLSIRISLVILLLRPGQIGKP